MSRQPRFEYPGASYHVMCRGNHGGNIFMEDADRALFLATLSEACDQQGWRVHAYVLMRNHYHLLLETPEANLVSGMKWFQGTYTQRFNARHRLRGHLFQGRYKAIPVQVGDGDLVYFKEVSSYIHLNPCRAGICGADGQPPLQSYRWSSYPAYIRSAKKELKPLVFDRVYRTHGLLAQQPETPAAYQQALERRMRWEADPNAFLREESIVKQIRRGWYLGDEGFADTLLERLGAEPGGDNLRGEVKRRHDERGAESLLQAFLAEVEVEETELLSRPPGDPLKRAAAWMIQRYSSQTVVWIARRLEMKSRANASAHIHRFAQDERPEGVRLREICSRIAG